MRKFGWVAPSREPPDQWDLRRAGWHLGQACGNSLAECKNVLLCDVRDLDNAERMGLVEADRPAWRLILLGVEEAAERARLLTLGCAEALPSCTSLKELTARAKRIDEMFGLLPRWRMIGPLTLDLFHRDARQGTKWLHLHPREFGVMWRLSDMPGECVTRRQLLQDVWRINHVPETNSVEVHVSRLRSKLAGVGCEKLLETVPEGGYRLGNDVPFMLANTGDGEDALDRYLRKLNWKNRQISPNITAE